MSEPQDVTTLGLTYTSAVIGFPTLNQGISYISFLLFVLLFHLIIFLILNNNLIFYNKYIGQIIIYDISGILDLIANFAYDGIIYIPDDASTGDQFGASLIFYNEDTLYVGAPYHMNSGIKLLFFLIIIIIIMIIMIIIITKLLTFLILIYLGVVYVMINHGIDGWIFSAKIFPSSDSIKSYGLSMSTYGFNNNVAVSVYDTNSNIQGNILIVFFFFFK